MCPLFFFREVSIVGAVEACCGLAGLAVGERSGKILKESHSLISAIDMLLRACHPRHKVKNYSCMCLLTLA